MATSAREPRISSTARGIAIGVLISVYAVVMHQPTVSFSAGLLIGAGLQAAVVLVRRVVPADEAPRIIDLCEMVADAITVLLFALAVLGGLWRMPADL